MSTEAHINTACAEQQLHNLQVALVRSHDQWAVHAVPGSIDVRTRTNQHRHYITTTVRGEYIIYVITSYMS